jgi:DNA-binding MarR family transcriptional regulator
MNPNVFTILENVVHVYHRLTAASDLIHADRALTTGMRSLMVGLAASGPRTVARMADDRPVSRQYIQRLVDELLELGLVEARANPDHKRSPLIALTRKGKAQTVAIARIEAPLLERLFEGLPDKDLAAAARVLKALSSTLSPETLKEIKPGSAMRLSVKRASAHQESEQ